MNISQIDLYSVPLPYSGGVYHLSKGRTYETFQSLIVRVTASDGTEGWGESTPFGSTYAAAHPAGTQAAIELLAPETTRGLFSLLPEGLDAVLESPCATWHI